MWWSIVVGCFSVGSFVYFWLGVQEFGEFGWWKFVYNRFLIMRLEGEKLVVFILKVKVLKLMLDFIIIVEGFRKWVSWNFVEFVMELKEKWL